MWNYKLVITGCDFISLHWSIKCRPVIWTGHRVQRQSAKKMLTQWNNGAICSDWWKPSVRGGRKSERVSLWVFMTVGFGSCTVRVKGPCYSDSVSLMVWECVSSVLKVSQYKSTASPLRSFPWEQKHRGHWQALFIKPLLLKPTFHCRKARPLHISSPFEDIKSERCIQREKDGELFIARLLMRRNNNKKGPSGEYAPNLWCWTMTLS